MSEILNRLPDSSIKKMESKLEPVQVDSGGQIGRPYTFFVFELSPSLDMASSTPKVTF